jgi:predicted esterase
VLRKNAVKGVAIFHATLPISALKTPQLSTTGVFCIHGDVTEVI